MNHQVLCLKLIVDLTLHILVSKGTSERMTGLCSQLPTRGKQTGYLGDSQLPCSLPRPQVCRSERGGWWVKAPLAALTRPIGIEGPVFGESLSLVSLKKTLREMTKKP